MLNQVTIAGRMTKDADLRYTQSGIAVANFTIAANRPFKNQNTGEYEADFINCVAWKQPAENLANYMKKGDMVGVEGRIQTRTFESKEGKTIFVTEVVATRVSFLEPKKSNQKSGSNNQGNQKQSSHQNNGNDLSSNKNGPIDINDEDLPF